MNRNIYCEDCDLEYRVRHDADEEVYIPKFCPFCGTKYRDFEESYDCDEEGED